MINWLSRVSWSWQDSTVHLTRTERPWKLLASWTRSALSARRGRGPRNNWKRRQVSLQCNLRESLRGALQKTPRLRHYPPYPRTRTFPKAVLRTSRTDWERAGDLWERGRSGDGLTRDRGWEAPPHPLQSCTPSCSLAVNVTLPEDGGG